MVTVSADPILAAIQAGDRTAWGRAFAEHRERMYAAAFRVLRDQHDSLDAVQNAFSSVMTSAPDKLATVDSLGPYLAGVARNKAIDLIRKNHRIQATDPDEMSDLTSGGLDVEELAGDRLALETAADVLSVMPEDARYAYKQRVLMGRKAKEVAAELGCTPQYIPQLIKKALTILDEHSPFIESATSDPLSPTPSSATTKDAT